jgi:hypothetical protein
MVAAAGKSGYLYGLSRDLYGVFFKTPVTRIENVDAPLTAQGTRFLPGAQGGTNWYGPSYSPPLNALFVPTIDWGITIRLAAAETLKARAPQTLHRFCQWFGEQDPQRFGHITAVDADSGKVIWTNDTDTPMVASVTPTAGSLILTADTKGKFYPIGRDERDCSAEEGFGRSHWRRRGYLHARRNSVCGGRGRHEEPHRLDRRESRSFASRSTKAVSLSEIATFWTLERMLSRVLLCMTVVGMMITCARIQCAHGGIPND